MDVYDSRYACPECGRWEMNDNGICNWCEYGEDETLQ